MRLHFIFRRAGSGYAENILGCKLQVGSVYVCVELEKAISFQDQGQYYAVLNALYFGGRPMPAARARDFPSPSNFGTRSSSLAWYR